MTGENKDYLTAAYFWEVLRYQIHFGEALTVAAANGAISVDLGPSNTLANLAKAHFRQRTDVSIFSILSPYSNNAKVLESVYAKLRNESNKYGGDY
ncbi:hypothetical protein [Paenibacillus sp. NPDC055715]